MTILWSRAMGSLALIGVAVMPCLRAGPVAQSPSSWHPPKGQHCTPFPFPGHLPAASELLDSAGTVAILGGDSAFAGASELVALSVDTTGALRQVRVLETSLPPDEARRLATALATMLLPQSPAAAGQFRLGIDLAPPARAFTDRSELCHLALQPGQVRNVVDSVRIERLEPIGTARMTDRDILGPRVDTPPGLASPRRERMTRWLVTVDAAGHTLEAIPMTSGGPVIPRNQVLRMAFNPALLDRIPVTMSDTVTIGGP